MGGTSIAQALLELPHSPALYPMALNIPRSTLLFVRMNEAGYRASSFLDERAVLESAQGFEVGVAQVTQAIALPSATRPLHFIFHMGHVGSTLLSRLLDETGQVLSLREPLPLRAIADAYDIDAPKDDALLETMLRLWERGFPGTQAVVLKATSTAERIAPRLLAMRPKARAVLMSVSAETYLTTMFAAPYPGQDLNGHGPERLMRLERLLKRRLPRPGTIGQLAAMSWLAEHLTQARIAQSFEDRVLRVDFDKMLLSMNDALEDVSRFFGLRADRKTIEAIAAGGTLRRYAKAPDREYSPGIRAARLAAIQSEYRSEIDAALEWLAKLQTG
ncbi:MAG: hypothetical protein WDM89_01945 [Rhizomicrobium sp.]